MPTMRRPCSSTPRARPSAPPSAGAHREAVAHLATALRHAAALGDCRARRLLERHAAGCNMTNQVAESIASADAALALWRELGDVAAQARVHLLLAQQYWKAGDKHSVDRQVAAAISLLESLPPVRSWPWPTAAGRATP